MSLTLPTTFSWHCLYHLVTLLASLCTACHAPLVSLLCVAGDRTKVITPRRDYDHVPLMCHKVNIHLLFYCLIHWCSCKSLKLLSKVLLKIYIQIIQRQCREWEKQWFAHWETRYVLTMVALSTALTHEYQLSEHVLYQSALPGSSLTMKHFPSFRGNVNLFRKFFFPLYNHKLQHRWLFLLRRTAAPLKTLKEIKRDYWQP